MYSIYTMYRKTQPPKLYIVLQKALICSSILCNWYVVSTKHVACICTPCPHTPRLQAFSLNLTILVILEFQICGNCIYVMPEKAGHHYCKDRISLEVTNTPEGDGWTDREVDKYPPPLPPTFWAKNYVTFQCQVVVVIMH